MKSTFDCIIIGAGIAGMTAAIYLKRANANVLIIDKDAPGGLLNSVKKIENYPGFESISGPDLAFKVYEQLQANDIEIQYGNVVSIDNHIVKTDIGEYETKYIIIASGRQAKKITQKNLDNLSYCVLCDANLYKNKVVALITDDNSEDALYLADICKTVILVSDKIKINKENVICEENMQSFEIENNVIKKIKLQNKEYDVDGVFISFGYEPTSNFLDTVEKENGYLIINPNMQTSIDYIYACGDIVKKNLYQVSTAIGEAAIASTNIVKRLKDK